MTTKAFEPKFMKVGVLTAALQELTPREVRDPDPDRAIEEWVAFAKELGAELHPAVGGAAPDRDRRAARGDARSGREHARPAQAVRQGPRQARPARRSTARKVGISEVGYFDNMLHDDPAIRKKKHDFMLRAFDAAALLGVDAVCGFVGRNQKHSMDQNLIDFEEQFVPLLKEAKSRGLTYRVEQCPMPGWTTRRQLAQQHRLHARGVDCAAPDLREARRRRSVPDSLRPVTRDPDGPGHAVDLSVSERHRLQLPHRRVSRQRSGRRCQGRVGVGIRRPDARARRLEEREAVAENPADQLNAWKKQVVLAEHELPGTARHDPLAYLQNRTVDWFDHQLAARELLKLDVANTHLVVEHEYPEGAHSGQGAAQADPAGIHRLRPSHRRGGRLHVCAAARSARIAEDPGAGRGTGSV